ncbi:MAG TPA: hypothetical protein PLL88_06685 [Anaerolineaceae bacterium]|nr:hypothetical protein [Anaerolineaceae bacterium]
MSIISAIQDYIKTYTSLKHGAPVWVDFLGPEPTQYAITPLPGTRVLEEDIVGNKIMSYPFAFQTMESTADDLERLETQGFYEAFAEWLELQSESGNPPVLGERQIAESIEATGWGYLYEQGDSQTGVYQVQCRLVYTQKPREEESEESS